jgi:hypothetical protein
MRLYTDFLTLIKVKTLLTPMREEARMEEVKVSKTLYMLDEPLVPEKKIQATAQLHRCRTCRGHFWGSCAYLF